MVVLSLKYFSFELLFDSIPRRRKEEAGVLRALGDLGLVSFSGEPLKVLVPHGLAWVTSLVPFSMNDLSVVSQILSLMGLGNPKPEEVSQAPERESEERVFGLLSSQL